MLIATLYVLGLALVITEFVHRCRMIFAGTGTLLLVLSLVLYGFVRRNMHGLFYLTLGALALLFAVHLTLLVVNKREWIKHYKERRSGGLVGLAGRATTDIDGSGHILLDGTVVLVGADEFIPCGSEVKIVAVGDGRITVRPFDGGKNAD